MARAVRQPRPPKPPKPVRPRVKELRKTYKALITLDQGQRLSALAAAMAWYDKAFMYLLAVNKGQLTADQAKKYDVATKARSRGISTNFPGEKETAYLTTLRLYEKICKDSKLDLVLVDDFYKIFERKKDVLEEKQERLTEKFGDIAELIQKSLHPVNTQDHVIKIQVGQVKERFQPDPTISSITIRRDVAKELARKKSREGLLPMALDFIRATSGLICQEPQVDASGNFTGRYVAPLSKVRNLEHKMLDNLVAFARTDGAPKRLVRIPVAEISVPAQPGQAVAPKKVRTGRGPLHGPKVDGLFVEGTDIAFIYGSMKDGNWHEFGKLQSQISAKLAGRLRKLDKTGRKKIDATGEGFRVEIQGDKVRLNFTAPKTTQQVQP